MRIAVLAGETSGDLLGAAIIRALRQRFPAASFYGVTGPRMREAGCESVANIDALSVMGLAEVLPKLPSILQLRAALRRRFLADRPDCVIGVDAPDFNLPLERRLREAGLKTAHVVSPTVWAWRAGRVNAIARSVDLLLCLFPFEPKFYAQQGATLKTVFIGHPLAEELAEPIAQSAARERLGLPAAARVVAILPGSRGGELKYLAEPFVQSAAWLAQRYPDLHFVVPLAQPSLRAGFETAVAQFAPQLHWHLIDGESRAAMRAADVVLLASGTATLECLLLDRPMVVGYRVSAFTAWLLRSLRLLKVERVSLPNLLCAEAVVPEFLQEQAQPSHFGAALEKLLLEPAARGRQLSQFSAVRQQLKQDAAARAAQAIAELLAR
ncbi:MAG: lipid-A-disaccharide synthase [Nevskia sp.]|nr:lipid-A-disaccharide synthase [Nevskia sp.]